MQQYYLVTRSGLDSLPVVRTLRQQVCLTIMCKIDCTKVKYRGFHCKLYLKLLHLNGFAASVFHRAHHKQRFCNKCNLINDILIKLTQYLFVKSYILNHIIYRTKFSYNNLLTSRLFVIIFLDNFQIKSTKVCFKLSGK